MPHTPLKFIEASKEIGILHISSDSDPYLHKEFVAAFEDAVEQVNKKTTLRCLLLVGTEKYFSAGASQSSLTKSDEKSISTYVKVPPLLLSINVPTIACMQGHAIGGGLVLGLWCDFVYMSLQSLYGANFMELGFTPGMGSTFVLEEAFGVQFAREMMFTGELYKGRKLKEISVPIAYAIDDKANVLKRTKDLADKISTIAQEPLILLKETLAARRKDTLSQILMEEKQMHSILFAKPQTRERIKAQYAQSLLSGERHGKK